MASRRELYKIRINLIDQNNNEFIIDNMNNILLEDFSDKESFDYFKNNSMFLVIFVSISILHFY